MNIFGWLADWEGCGTYRVIMPLNMLSERHPEWDISYSNKLDLESRPDILIGQRVSVDHPSKAFQAASKGSDTKTIFEIDDLLTRVHPKNRSAWDYYGDPAVHANLMDNIRAANHIVVSTRQLADEIRELNPSITVFPNCIDETVISPRTGKPDDRLVVGWAGGHSHAIDFERVRYPLRQFFKRNPDVVFHTIGEDYGRVLGLPEHQRRHTPWQKSIPDYLAALDFDIGIAPLHPMQFNQSKSHIKALEYAARGIPVVASNFGPYADFVDHGRTGLLCQYDRDWTQALTSLVTDDSLRAKMGAEAMEEARKWTIQRRIGEYEEILEAL